MIPETLITYIETAIIPRYKEFDKAHNSHTSVPSSEKALPSPGNIPKRTVSSNRTSPCAAPSNTA